MQRNQDTFSKILVLIQYNQKSFMANTTRKHKINGKLHLQYFMLLVEKNFNLHFSQIQIHSNDWPSLHEYINSEELPYEYGGTGPDIDFDYYAEKLYDQNEEIEDRLQYRKAILTDQN